MNYIFSALAGYLIGSVNVAIIITKYILKDDVRNHGSGNAGATNVARTFGWLPGILTFFCDFLKCAASVYIGFLLCSEWGRLVAGCACLLGHCFPIYFGFKGGKGVSTGGCIAFLINWKVFVFALAAFAIIALITKIVSLASLAAATTLAITALIFAPSLPLKILGVFTGILVIIMHYPNIKRLIKGEEKRFKAKSKNGDESI